MAYDDTSKSRKRTFPEILQARRSRRAVLTRGLATAASAFFAGTMTAGRPRQPDADRRSRDGRPETPPDRRDGLRDHGIAVTPDRRTMFVNVQHPGNGDPAVTNFPAPADGMTVPRDATIVISRENGGVTGS